MTVSYSRTRRAGLRHLSIALLSLLAGCNGSNPPPDTGDGGNPPGGDGGEMPPPQFPYTLTPLTRASTSTANISLYFAVTDANNRGVPGLGCSNSANCAKLWTDLEDGQPVDPNESNLEVTALAGNNLDVPTVLVLDISGNIIKNGSLPQLQMAANAIVDAMLPEQRMAIMAFADKPDLRQDFTSDKKMLKAAIANLGNANDGVSSDLFGAVVQALGMWQDGFNADPSMTRLTAGMVIVVASGEDQAAVATFQQSIQARGNKRLVAVGVGANGAFGSVNTLKCLATGCGGCSDPGDVDGGVPTGGSTGDCGGYFAFDTYNDLVASVGQVTNAIESLAHSIYLANYCSPKRGSNMHEVTFSVVGNPTNAVDATCTPATFDRRAPQACTGEDTQVCAQEGNNVTCAPPEAPYYCSASNKLYYTAADAKTDCGNQCVLCGGDGSGAMEDSQLQPGPAIHVQFNSTGYVSGQCPSNWGTNCKGLQTCCASLDPMSNGAAACQQSLQSAVGDEMMCGNSTQRYCPTLGPDCMNFKSCCGTFPDGPAHQQCENQLLNYYQNPQTREMNCAMSAQVFCPPAGSACDGLKTCCTQLGPGGQTSCLNALTGQSFSRCGGGMDAQCMAETAAFCPAGMYCSALAACCAKFGTQVGSGCYQDLQDYDNYGCPGGNDAQCNNQNETARYCPTSPSCVSLQTCCAAKPMNGQITRDDCEFQLVRAQNDENSCAQLLMQEGC